MELLTKSTTIEVIIHPLVLLSVADHYNRVAKDSRNKRVVGVLLGSKTGNSVDVCNSFAVPFEEDASSPKVWFLDHRCSRTNIELDIGIKVIKFHFQIICAHFKQFSTEKFRQSIAILLLLSSLHIIITTTQPIPFYTFIYLHFKILSNDRVPVLAKGDPPVAKFFLEHDQIKN
jgi:hypothetical protein